jgi:putative addiction module component (TIGR02574 family)
MCYAASVDQTPGTTSTTPAQRVLTDAMRLSEDERLDVATELLASLEGPEDGVDDDAWLAEVRRRAERVERGESQSVSWDEAKRQVLGRLQAR